MSSEESALDVLLYQSHLFDLVRVLNQYDIVVQRTGGFYFSLYSVEWVYFIQLVRPIQWMRYSICYLYEKSTCIDPSLSIALFHIENQFP